MFSIESGELNPDSMMRSLRKFKFDGEEGINKFEVWQDFDELRLEFIFKRPKYVRIAKFTGEDVEFERLKMETFVPVDVHVRSSGLVEAYGPAGLCEKAAEMISVLGSVDPVVFGPKDFKKVMRMASDIRKVRVYGIEDEQVVEIILLGGGLSASEEMRRYKSSGKIRELNGRLELPGGIYGFTMREKNIKFFVKDGEEAQRDIEHFIDSLIS